MKRCECGCGEIPKGRNSRFLPGHDLRKAYAELPIARCECVMKNRHEEESMRDWLKRCMCMHHWQQTDYYQAKLDPGIRTWFPES